MNQSKYIKIQNKQAGFTLLELLMVIAVIGILATIAVPRLQNYSQKAKFTEVINIAGSYKMAVEKCIADTGVLRHVMPIAMAFQQELPMVQVKWRV